MPIYPGTLEVFVDWARQEFSREISTGFARMQMFDHPVFKIVLATLRAQSPEQMTLLARAFPEPEKEKLTVEERNALEAFGAEKTRIYRAHHAELAKQITGFLEKPFQDEARKIRKRAGGIFKEIADGWNCQIRKEEPAVWVVTRTEKWGTVSVDYDLHQGVEFTYAIRVKSGLVKGLPRRDSFLASLGVMGQSTMIVSDAETCAEEFRKLSELIHWQVGEYVRIMETLPKSTGATGAGR